jgi:hypothetical protein
MIIIYSGVIISARAFIVESILLVMIRTTKKGQPGQDSQQKTARAGQPGEDSQDRTVKTSSCKNVKQTEENWHTARYRFFFLPGANVRKTIFFLSKPLQIVLIFLKVQLYTV